MLLINVVVLFTIGFNAIVSALPLLQVNRTVTEVGGNQTTIAPGIVDAVQNPLLSTRDGDISIRGTVGPRRYYVIITDENGHMKPVWIAVTVITSVLLFGTIVSTVLYCCFYSKHARKTRAMKKDLAERAKVAEQQITPGAFDPKQDQASHQADLEQWATSIPGPSAGRQEFEMSRIQ